MKSEDIRIGAINEDDPKWKVYYIAGTLKEAREAQDEIKEALQLKNKILEAIHRLLDMEQSYPHVVLCKGHCCSKYHEYPLEKIFERIKDVVDSNSV